MTEELAARILQVIEEDAQALENVARDMPLAERAFDMGLALGMQRAAAIVGRLVAHERAAAERIAGTLRAAGVG